MAAAAELLHSQQNMASGVPQSKVDEVVKDVATASNNLAGSMNELAAAVIAATSAASQLVTDEATPELAQAAQLTEHLAQMAMIADAAQAKATSAASIAGIEAADVARLAEVASAETMAALEDVWAVVAEAAEAALAVKAAVADVGAAANEAKLAAWAAMVVEERTDAAHARSRSAAAKAAREAPAATSLSQTSTLRCGVPADSAASTDVVAVGDARRSARFVVQRFLLQGCELSGGSADELAVVAEEMLGTPIDPDVLREAASVSLALASIATNASNACCAKINAVWKREGRTGTPTCAILPVT